MTLDSLTSHAESTSSTFLYLQLSLLSLSASTALSHAASHLGVAQGITTLLRALPYHASQGRMVIPAEITARHGVSQEEVFRRGGQAKGIDDAVFEFASAANANLETCAQILASEGRVPGRAKATFLNTVCRTSLLCPYEPDGWAGPDPTVSRAPGNCQFQRVRSDFASPRVEVAVEGME